jgi:hypothetical protein
MVKISSRASCAARSVPTPQSEVMGFFSGEILFSGGDIARTIQTVHRRFNGKELKRILKFFDFALA